MANVSGAVTDTSSSNDSCDKGKEDSTSENCNGESNSKEGNIGESNVSKPSILKTPISSSGFVLRSSKFDSPGNNLFGLHNTPKTDSDSASPRGRFILNPPKLSNPFVKVDKDEEEEEPKSTESTSSTSKQPENREEEKVATPSNKTSVSFVPLGGDVPTPSQPNSLTAASTPSLGFVFGQNIHEKVEAAAPAESTSIAAEPSPSKDSPELTSNGTSSEMLFSVRVPRDSIEKNDAANKSLSEAAREYEEARAVKRKFEEVPILTGEEEEANVLQINCKLFSFSNCTWLERGRGTLRVNDLPTSPGSHRLIVRTAGNFRVVLNTKIWSEMNVDRVSTKSLRITGMDSNGVVKVFVVMASPKEIDQLQKCLEWRVNNLKKNEDSPPKKVKPEDS